MKWSLTHKSGPCYSNVSLIKRSLFQSKSGKLPYPEIVQYVINHWNKNDSTSETDVISFVDLALNAPKSFFEEDENGLWGSRSQTDETLDPIINYAKALRKPFQLKELVRKFKLFNNERELREFLLRDIRFTELEGTSYWLLSEWELINDQVYIYMQNKNIESADKVEIQDLICKKFNFEKEGSIFFPEADNRFSLRYRIVSIELENNTNLSKEIVVTKAIREELARKSLKLLDWVRQQQGEFKIKNSVAEVLLIKANHPSYPVYFQAVEEFFENVPTLIKIRDGRWINVQESPALETANFENVSYAVYNSTPVINNVDELVRLSESAELKSNKTNFEKLEKTRLVSYAYTTVSYYERVKGYLVLPDLFLKLLNLEDRKMGKTIINIEGYEYDCWLRIKEDKVYCYGNGIFDFFTDYLIEPGSKLKIEVGEQNSLVIHLYGMDERYAIEQQRFIDIGKLVEESKRVNKSIFTIMCEIMATYPSGIYWATLLERVNEIRSTTKNTVTNLLSRNECFVSVPNMKGYWQLNITKLSGYYIDENDQSVALELEFDETISNPIENIEETVNADVEDEEEVFPNRQEDELSPTKEVEDIILVGKLHEIPLHEDNEVVFENNVIQISEDVTEEIKLVENKEEIRVQGIEDKHVKLDEEEITINILEVGNITSGKKLILSFTDSTNKQINSFPFLLKNGTVTHGEKDGYYNYNYHWDLRLDHDIEEISNQFTEIFPYKSIGLYEGLANISEVQYTELMKYKIYCLIKNEEFIFKLDDNSRILVQWNGNEITQPEWYHSLEMGINDLGHDFSAQNDAIIKAEMISAPQGTNNILVTNEDYIPIQDSIIENANIVKGEIPGTKVKEGLMDQDSVLDKSQNEVNFELKTPDLPVTSESTKVQQNFQIENQNNTDLITRELLFEETNRLEKRISDLEKKVKKLDVENKKYRKTMKLLFGLAIGIGVTSLIFSFFRS